MNISHQELKEALSESQLEVLKLIEKNDTPSRPEGFGITHDEFSELNKHKFGKETARKKLNGLVRDGTLERKTVRGKRGKVTIFFAPGTWPD